MSTRTPEDEAFDAKHGEQAIGIGGRHRGALHVGGPELTIETHGRVYRFEWHSYCGPMPVDRNGNGRHLGHRDPFWVAVSHWAEQGKKLDENRRAIWEEPKPAPPEDLVRVGRNLYPREMYEKLKTKTEARSVERKAGKR